MNLICAFAGHRWHQHPDFVLLPVRECQRCGRAERRTWTGNYVKHISAAKRRNEPS